MPLVAREPTVRTLPVSKDIPNNPTMAKEIFLHLLDRQRRERGNTVVEGYVKANKAFKVWFVQIGYQQFARNLPKVSLESLTKETNEAGTAATSSFVSSVVNSSQADPVQVQVAADDWRGTPDELAVSDPFASSRNATPLRD